MSDEERMQCHCGACVSGVLFTFLGISLLSTGVAMVMDYGAFDLSTLPSGWQNSDGQRNLGIILICAAVVMLTGSVVISVLFFTNKLNCQSATPDREAGKAGGDETTKEVIPKPPSVIVTVSQSSETLQRPAPHRSSKGKRRRKKSRKPAPIQLETHHECAEEQNYPMTGKDPRSASKRTLSVLLREKPRDGSVVSLDHDGDRTESETDIITSSSHLPPLLIAPAKETISTCEEDNDTPPNEPSVFRVEQNSLSSEDGSSIIASTSTPDTSTACSNTKEANPYDNLDRELSDILK